MFWTKFLVPVEEPEPIADKVEHALNQIERGKPAFASGKKQPADEENGKKGKEMSKIKRLDMQLAAINRTERRKRKEHMQS